MSPTAELLPLPLTSRRDGHRRRTRRAARSRPRPNARAHSHVTVSRGGEVTIGWKYASNASIAPPQLAERHASVARTIIEAFCYFLDPLSRGVKCGRDRDLRRMLPIRRRHAGVL